MMLLKEVLRTLTRCLMEGINRKVLLLRVLNLVIQTLVSPLVLIILSRMASL